MTLELQKFIFPNLNNFKKVGIFQFFPFLSKFRSNSFQTSNTNYDRTSDKSFITKYEIKKDDLIKINYPV